MTDENNTMNMTDLFGDDDSSDEEVHKDKEDEDDSGAKTKSETEANSSPVQGNEAEDKAAALKEEEEDDDDDEGFTSQLDTHNPLTSESKARDSAGYADEYVKEEDEEEDELPPRDVEMMNIPKPLNYSGNNAETHIMKFTNILGIQSDPFEEDVYDYSREEEMYGGHTQNLIRWRYKRDSKGNVMKGEDGKLLRESNARFIQYSDGSIQFQIGEERFEIDAHPAAYSYVYASQVSKVENNQQLTLLESQGPAIKSKFLARPASMRSSAHKNLTLSLRSTTLKQARIQEFTTYADPEKLKQEKIKNKNELAKDQRRRSAGGRSAYRRRIPGMNSRYLDDEDDNGMYESTNISSMKRNIRDGGYDSEDDYEEEETYRWKQDSAGRSKKSRTDSSTSDDDVAADDSSSDEEDVVAARSRGRVAKASHALESDDDSD